MKILKISSVILTIILSGSMANAATCKNCQTYTLSNFISQSKGSLIDGKLASVTNTKIDGIPFVIIPDGHISFVKTAGGDLAGKTIFVPALKNCLAIGSVNLPAGNKSAVLAVNSLVCPNQKFQESAVMQVGHYSLKNINGKINYSFRGTIPTGTKVQIYSSAPFTESLCDSGQYKAFLLNHLELGQDFKDGFWSGCSGQPVIVPSISAPVTTTSQITGVEQ